MWWFCKALKDSEAPHWPGTHGRKRTEFHEFQALHGSSITDNDAYPRAATANWQRLWLQYNQPIVLLKTPWTGKIQKENGATVHKSSPHLLFTSCEAQLSSLKDHDCSCNVGWWRVPHHFRGNLGIMKQYSQRHSWKVLIIIGQHNYSDTNFPTKNFLKFMLRKSNQHKQKIKI